MLITGPVLTDLPSMFARLMFLVRLLLFTLLILVRELHADTITALQEFYSERDAQEKRFQDLKSHIEQKSSQAQLSMELFSEDWNASQFWVCRRYLQNLTTI